MVPVPAPSIFAPQAFKKRQSSPISGSLAAPSRTVSPSARTAAATTFSVAPTLGNGRPMTAPLRRDTFAVTTPSRSSKQTPICSSACRCRSMGRSPMEQPPGLENSTCPTRPSNGPRSMMEERIWLMASRSIVWDETPDASIVRRPLPASPRRQPRESSIPIIQDTSCMPGTFSRTTVSLFRMAAAITGSTPFFDP